MKPIYTITPDNIILYKGAGGRRLIANRANPNFNRIVERIKANQFTNIERLFEVKKTAEKIMNVVIQNNNEVFYKGRKLDNSVSETLLQFVKLGYPYKAFAKFLSKLMDNPSENSRLSLYGYLSKNLLPITEDGDFVACKAIRNDWMDIHSGKVCNKIGETVFMDRKKVNASPSECAGSGLHVGATHYIKSYGKDHNGARFIMCKVNPRDVVIIPNEGVYQKIRLCRYKVIAEIKEENLDFNAPYAPANKQYAEIRQNRSKNGRFQKGFSKVAD